MSGPNLTGLSKTEDYNLGRGRVMVAKLSSDVPDANGYRDLGNVPSFKITDSAEVLKHFSSRSGLKVLDREIVLSQEFKLSFDAEEVNDDNLALFMSGERAAYTNAAIAGFAEHQMITAVKKGRWYPIKSGAGARAYDIDAADLTVEKSGAPDTALVLDTDYVLDLEMGLVFFKTTGVVLADGDPVDVTLAADAGAAVVYEVRALTTSGDRFSVMFISENAGDGDAKREYVFHKVNLKASGDFDLISDQVGKMSFEGAAETNETADANSPTCTTRTFVQ